jgi:hypothetical protein
MFETKHTIKLTNKFVDAVNINLRSRFTFVAGIALTAVKEQNNLIFSLENILLSYVLEQA